MPFIIIIIFGALASCFALIFEFILLSPASSPFDQSITFSLTAAATLLALALIEETSKYLFLRQYALRYLKDTTTGIRNIFLLSALFGIGFSLLELALSIQGGMPISFFPTLGRSILHIGTSLILASFIFRPSGTTFTSRAFIIVLATALIHLFYNIAFLVL